MFKSIDMKVKLKQVSVALNYLDQIDELLSASLMTISIACYTFYINYVTQQVRDSSTAVFQDLFNVNWYNAPVEIQRMTLFIMMRSTKIFTFDLYGLYSASIEGFSLLTRMSFSYFMVLQSYQ